ncbi:unnamed protein product [Calicophoron daubneyi]|uniref:Acyltransferase n=1 Tax=Calicophoron daubneyi TaxID=300641 RepID=A0AAV2T3F6_CALDB
MLSVSSTKPGILRPFTTGHDLDSQNCHKVVSLAVFIVTNIFWLYYFYLLYCLLTAPFYFGPSHPRSSVLLVGIICYVAYHWIKDKDTSFRGVYLNKMLRHASFWSNLFNYFPVQMILSDELIEYSQKNQEFSTSGSDDVQGHRCAFSGLPADRNYLLCYHPHGLMGQGALACFGTEAVGFSKVFPGLKPWVAIHPAFFRAPLMREIVLSLGSIAATNNEIRYQLDTEMCGDKGNLVTIVPGGGMEMLESRNDSYTLYLNRRYGIFRLALETGSALIPTISFGETKVYTVIAAKRGTFFRRIQDYFIEMLGVQTFLFYGNGLAPYRRSVNVVVGAPIPCDRVPHPTREQIAELKSNYIKSLTSLFEKYKVFFDPEAGELEMI